MAKCYASTLIKIAEAELGYYVEHIKTEQKQYE